MFLSVRAAVSWRRRQNSLGAGGVFYVPCQSSLLRGKEEDLLQQAMTRDFKSGASRWALAQHDSGRGRSALTAQKMRLWFIMNIRRFCITHLIRIRASSSSEQRTQRPVENIKAHQASQPS